jgi:hypothetical protein
LEFNGLCGKWNLGKGQRKKLREGKGQRKKLREGKRGDLF